MMTIIPFLPMHLFYSVEILFSLSVFPLLEITIFYSQDRIRRPTFALSFFAYFPHPEIIKFYWCYVRNRSVVNEPLSVCFSTALLPAVHYLSPLPPSLQYLSIWFIAHTTKGFNWHCRICFQDMFQYPPLWPYLSPALPPLMPFLQPSTTSPGSLCR